MCDTYVLCTCSVIGEDWVEWQAEWPEERVGIAGKPHCHQTKYVPIKLYVHTYIGYCNVPGGL